MRNFYKVVRGRVLYKNKIFNAGEIIFALPEEINSLIGGGDIVRVPDNEFPSEVPPFFLDEVDSGGSENQFNSTNISGFLSSIYSILATKPSLQQVRDAIKAPAAELGLGSVTIISDFTIPTSGDVIVNPSSRNFLNEGDFIFGNISGVEGVLSRAGDIYTFTRQKSGTAISITGGIASFYPLRSNQIIFSVSTIAALRNRPFVTTDEKVFVNGKISVSDGLWGIYRADINDTTSNDDGLLVIVSLAGTRWKRIASADVLSIASSATLGGVKIGSGINIDNTGTISVPPVTALEAAAPGTLGGVKIGSGITVDNTGTISVVYNSTTPSLARVGGIDAGTTFVDTPISTIIDQLLNPYQNPVITLTAPTSINTPNLGNSRTIEVGEKILNSSSEAITLTTSIQYSQNLQSSVITYKVDSTTVSNPFTPILNSSPNVRITPGFHTWMAFGTNSKGQQISSNPITITWAYKIFAGYSTSESVVTPDGLTPNDLTPITISNPFSRPTSITKPAGDGYTYIFLPVDYTGYTSFKSGGFPVAMETPTTVTLTRQGISGISYRRYRTRNKTAGSLTIDLG